MITLIYNNLIAVLHIKENGYPVLFYLRKVVYYGKDGY